MLCAARSSRRMTSACICVGSAFHVQRHPYDFDYTGPYGVVIDLPPSPSERAIRMQNAFPTLTALLALYRSCVAPVCSLSEASRFSFDIGGLLSARRHYEGLCTVRNRVLGQPPVLGHGYISARRWPTVTVMTLKKREILDL